MLAKRRLISACAYAQSDQTLPCQHEESLHPWLSKYVNWRFWSDCANVQADLTLRRAHLSEGSLSQAADFFFISATLRKHAYSTILKILQLKKENSQIKNSDIFHISARIIDCGNSLEPTRRGGSNEYPQSMFLSKNKKNNVYPCKPQFSYIKVGFKGVKII